jgi:hypothetical protein
MKYKRKSTFKNQRLLTLLFVDDQVIISNTENSLQKAACWLKQITRELVLTTSVEKSN